MGVKNLWDILDSCKKTLPLHHLRNKRVCIDLSCWIVQLQKVNTSHCSLKEKLYLRGLFHRLRALIALNCSLIFVTDGSIPALKIATYKRRLNLENEIVREDTDTQKASSLRRNMGSEFSCMIKEAKVLGMALGIPCLDGIEEAEAQCALLNSESVCDGCFTSDSDVFLFGARTVYRDICLGDGGYIVCYEMEDIEKKLGLGRNSLIALALLLGCDYSQGVHGFGPESACQVIKSLSDDIILQRLMSEGVSFLKKLKNLKKARQGGKDGNTENSLDHGNKQTGERNDEFSQVINAYLKPKCHSVDSDPVYRVLALHPFQRSALQHVCSQYFGWPPEKTDEYILPKIAERELRRFANLRSTSSEFGAQLPLHEMPIKCPISEVIKHRKVAGKECFEVSWLRFDGLQTSIVPADLVQSACPEKILEFEERRAQRKKQNRRKQRPKRSQDEASMINIDHKLQNLMLEIESDYARSNAFGTGNLESDIDSMNPRPLRSEYNASMIEIDTKFYDLAVGIESDSNAGSRILNALEIRNSVSDVDSINSRPLRLESNASMIETDLELHDLTVEIESDCNCRSKNSICSVPNASEIDLKLHNLTDEIKSDCNSRSKISLSNKSEMRNSVSDINSTNPRLVRSESNTSATDLDLKFQDLTLEIESDCNSQWNIQNASEIRTSFSDADSENLELNCAQKLAMCSSSDERNGVEDEVINLLSPTPQIHQRCASRCGGNSEMVEVIDLGESDVDASPEHERKVRELRLFLASIRDEIS